VRCAAVYLIFLFVENAQSKHFKLLHFFWCDVLQKMSGFDKISIYLKQDLGGAENEAS